MKKFLWGLSGAIVGAITALVTMVWGVGLVLGGDFLGEGFLFVTMAPLGLVAGFVFGAIIGILLYNHVTDNPALASLKAKEWFIARIVASVVAIDLAMGYASMHTNDPPSDQALLANFERHETAFNKIVGQVQQDKNLSYLSDGWATRDKLPAKSPDPSSNQAYLQLLREANFPHDVHVDENHAISFSCFASGSAEKGYLYAPTPPRPLLPTIDTINIRKADHESVFVYRHIKGNWYLYYVWPPG